MCLIFRNFILKLKHLRKHFTKMLIRQNLLDKCIAKFVNNTFIEKPDFSTVPKLELRKLLPYLRNNSSITKKRLNRCISKHLKFCKLKIIFQTSNRLKNYCRLKDRVPETLQSNFVCKSKCGSCTSSYYGKTYRHLKCVS